jgi:aspergillopepsin I
MLSPIQSDECADSASKCVELADKVSSSFLQGRNLDGLMGLAFSSINTVQPQQQKTFWENVLPELDQQLFTADLEEDNSGTYEFGKIDSSKYSGQIHYSPVDNSQGFWQVTSKSYTVGGQSHQCQECSPTIMDTGTSLILMDADVVKAYYSQVSGAQFDEVDGGYTYPCSTKLPDFGLTIGSYTSVIKGTDMTYIQSGSSCFGGLQSSEGAGMNIIGE